MAFAAIQTYALLGLEVCPVRVEADLANGLPSFSIVGLPGTAVREARDRVRAAIQHSGYAFPSRRITVNLSPADLPKHSGSFDLPIAMAVLAATEQIPAVKAAQFAYFGELSLSGELRRFKGAFATALACRRQKTSEPLVVPETNATEIAHVGLNPEALFASSLRAVCEHLNGQTLLTPCKPPTPTLAAEVAPLDLADIRGQTEAKQSLLVAAAGGHSLLLAGPPGCGKSMLANRMPTLLPDLDDDDAATAAAIQSLSGDRLPEHWHVRPFRAPHHSASGAALIGGGIALKPGEISRAFGGVLFLDELPEWNPRALEQLREPLESKRVVLVRATSRVEYPVKVQLIAAMNPCPCGWLGHPERPCRCSEEQVLRYRSRISGPLLDRFDIGQEMRAPDPKTLRCNPTQESSAELKERCCSAQTRQIQRQSCLNSELSAKNLDRHCPLASKAESLLQQAMSRYHLSARACHRVIRVARTLADLRGADTIEHSDLAQAIHYRRLLDHF